jgi:hypothetical protein
MSPRCEPKASHLSVHEAHTYVQHGKNGFFTDSQAFLLGLIKIAPGVQLTPSGWIHPISTIGWGVVAKPLISKCLIAKCLIAKPLAPCRRLAFEG